MKLLDLVRAYYTYLGGAEEFLDDIEDQDGYFTLSLEGDALCTLSERKDEATGRMKLSLQSSLSESTKSEAALLKAVEEYSNKLRNTPLYQKGYIVVTGEYSIGFSYETDAENVDEKSFFSIMDLFVATVHYLIDTVCDEPDSEDAKSRAEIYRRLFVPHENTEYTELLKECGINAKQLENNYGVYAIDDDYTVRIQYHELSGQLLLENAIPCNDALQTLCLLYINGSGITGSGYEIEDGYIHLITAINPGKTDREGFIEAVLTQRYLLDRSIEYLKDESKQVKELNLRKIITALLS